jgi:hypothetical protein
VRLAQGFNLCLGRMLKRFASGVLASLRGSTYRSVRLAPSFAAALLDKPFEHPVWSRPESIIPSACKQRCMIYVRRAGKARQEVRGSEHFSLQTFSPVLRCKNP